MSALHLQLCSVISYILFIGALGCGEEWLFWKAGNTCFLVANSTFMGNFTQGRDFCSSYNSSLVQVKSSEAWTFLKKNGGLDAGLDLWAGLTRENVSHRRSHLDVRRSGWRWLDGEPVTWSNWFEGIRSFSLPEPSGRYNCAVITHSGIWYDRGCGEKSGFICEKTNVTLPQEYITTSEELMVSSDPRQTTQYVNTHTSSIVTAVVSARSFPATTEWQDQNSSTSLFTKSATLRGTSTSSLALPISSIATAKDIEKTTTLGITTTKPKEGTLPFTTTESDSSPLTFTSKKSQQESSGIEPTFVLVSGFAAVIAIIVLILLCVIASGKSKQNNARRHGASTWPRKGARGRSKEAAEAQQGNHTYAATLPVPQKSLSIEKPKKKKFSPDYYNDPDRFPY